MKLTSPNLSCVIVLGAVLSLIGNLFHPGFPSRNKQLIAVLCIVSEKLASVYNFYATLNLMIFRLRGYFRLLDMTCASSLL